MRQEIRASLGTAPPAGTVPEPDSASLAPTDAPLFRAAAQQIINTFVGTLRQREQTELRLAFPAAPFILPLTAENPGQFLDYAEHRPAHDVELRRIDTGTAAEWQVSPRGDPGAYRLTFSMPEPVESWISENDEWRSKRTGAVKANLLSHISVYRQYRGQMRIYQLLYLPRELRRHRL
jgi:hypothetical protein